MNLKPWVFVSSAGVLWRQFYRNEKISALLFFVDF